MSQNLVIKTNILNPISIDKCQYQKNKFITISRSKIISITDECSEEYLDKTDLLCLPGFIDASV